MQRLLDREHDLGLDRVDVGREVVDEVVLGQPGEAVLVDVEMRQAGTQRSLLQQRADRLTLIQPEPGDVDQTNDVGRVGAERGDDLAAVGVPGNDGWPVLAGQDLAQPGDVIGQSGHRNWGAVTLYPSACKCSMTALQLEPSAQAPCTEDDVGQRSHDRAPSSLRSTMTTRYKLLVRELATGLELLTQLFLCGWYRRALAAWHRLASGLVRLRKDIPLSSII